MIYSFSRFIQIHFILAQYRLDKLLLPHPVLAPLRGIQKLRPKNWRHPIAPNRGAALRYALQQLSPIFVKFGQALATRRDLIPLDIADELALLQDKVPPFPNAKAYAEKLYGHPLEERFATFDETPLASASIAQVHAATLHTGEAVVLKLIRPDVHQKIHRDIRMLKWLARWLRLIWPAAKRLRPFEVVREFERTLESELDFVREGANASQLKRNFAGSDSIHVPKVYWEYTHTHCLVLERVNGIPISNTRELRRQNANFKRLAEIGVELFFTQVFRDNFFHADMHAGNIFVSLENPEHPKFIVVDFGIMGTLSSFDKRYLAQNFHAFLEKDYYRVAELHIQSGWVPKKTRVDEFADAVRAICEPILQKPIKDVSCAKLLVRLFDVGRQFDMELLPQLLLLQKTLFAIEGLGRDLYPDLDIWSTARPHIEAWMRRELSLRGLAQTLRKQWPYWLDILPKLPALIQAKLDTAEPLSPPPTHKRFHFFMGTLLGGMLALVFSHPHMFTI